MVVLIAPPLTPICFENDFFSMKLVLNALRNKHSLNISSMIFLPLPLRSE